MQRTILVPLDGSYLAEAALPHAAMLARYTGKRLRLLRVAERYAQDDTLGSHYLTPPNTTRSVELQVAVGYLDALAQRPGIAEYVSSTIALPGFAANEILSYVTAHDDVDLIVMATHGRHGLSRLFFGSVAEAVLRGATVPLLLIRPTQIDGELCIPEPRPYRRIMVPLDGGAVAEQALRPASELAEATGASLELLSVLPAPLHATEHDLRGVDYQRAASLARYLTQTAARQERDDLPVTTRLLSGRVAERILEVGAEDEADLIVMATHSRDGLARLRLGSVALSVAEESTLPLLLLRANAHAHRFVEQALLSQV